MTHSTLGSFTSKSAARSADLRERKAKRCKRAAAGQPRSTDWECPRCKQWFTRRWNGPSNHLRFCSSDSKPRQEPWYIAPAVATIPIESYTSTPLDLGAPSSEDLTDSDDSTNESDAGNILGTSQPKHCCRVRQVKTILVDETNYTGESVFRLLCD